MSKNNGSWITDCLYLLLVVAAITFFSSAFLYLLCRLQIGDFFELTESQKTDKVLSIEGRTNDREVLPQGNFSISKVDGGFLKGMSYILTGKLNNGGKNVRLLVVTSEKVETMLLEADEDGIFRLELPAKFKRLEIQ